MPGVRSTPPTSVTSSSARRARAALVTTPVHLRALLAEDLALPPLDFLVCATAPLSPQLAAAAQTRFAVRLHEVYGCTEAGQVATRCTVETPEWQTLDGIVLREDELGTWVTAATSRAKCC